MKKKILDDKNIITYRYKLPDELVQHQLKTIVQAEQLRGLKRVDFSIGGDHGGGKFRMTLKVLFRFENSNTISKLFQIASVSHSKDDTEILRSTVIDLIGVGAKRIVDGGHFSVRKDMSLSFSLETGDGIIRTVPNRLLIVGNLKFFAQMLGRENMSGSWCMWCRSHPSQWSNYGQSFPLWCINSLKSHKDKIISERLKEPKDICGVVSYPIWDFVEPSHYILPELYIEIGLLDNALDRFYNWVEDHVEAASMEEKLCRSKMIVLDTEVSKAVADVEDWKQTSGTVLQEKQCALAQVQRALRARTLSPPDFIHILAQQDELNQAISVLLQSRKKLEAAVGLRKKALTSAKKEFKEVRKKKKN